MNRRLRFDFLNKTHIGGVSQNSYSAENKPTQSLLSSCTAVHQVPAENKLGPFGLSCSFKITYRWERQWLQSLQSIVSQKKPLWFSTGSPVRITLISTQVSCHIRVLYYEILTGRHDLSGNHNTSKISSFIFSVILKLVLIPWNMLIPFLQVRLYFFPDTISLLICGFCQRKLHKMV